MTLKDGWYYQEKGDKYSSSDYIRLGFKEYTKQFDLSFLQFNRTSDTMYQNNQQMRNMKQLEYAIDSIRRDIARLKVRVKPETSPFLPFAKNLDSARSFKDTAHPAAVTKFDELIPDSIRTFVNEKAHGKLNSVKSINDILLGEYETKKKDLRLHLIEWHRKISLSLACLVLFLIGAPLGSIIRKGGLGSPLIFAIVFFMIFYFLSNTGQKMAKEGSINPFLGMWLSTFVLVPIGIFLTYKAMKDSQLFNKEFYFRFRRQLRRSFARSQPVATEGI
jgi:lipopolysaccharide export system permease protein